MTSRLNISLSTSARMRSTVGVNKRWSNRWINTRIKVMLSTQNSKAPSSCCHRPARIADRSIA